MWWKSHTDHLILIEGSMISQPSLLSLMQLIHHSLSFVKKITIIFFSKRLVKENSRKFIMLKIPVTLIQDNAQGFQCGNFARMHYLVTPNWKLPRLLFTSALSYPAHDKSPDGRDIYPYTKAMLTTADLWKKSVNKYHAIHNTTADTGTSLGCDGSGTQQWKFGQALYK